ncbi:50S ribosomal protein L20 [candidate division WWE3 bacterium RIFOXYC1_FULL_39_7]|uniref:Large ribosomal subunit protein bL20 n=2 Tax=Katanobacteria TaxID=422282 RepID=A0A1F4X8T1_UNCKA|nr:MAG: 50S ribosomal protein L20 [candidate division WWE3 bacterium RIFOXYC1_FULL_39_7]OGC78115.1 MAG: 50S ribosomal protein L20 [candidate division WWE3 bacterium RIFOXYD1_FULL_39_9]
MPRVKGGPRGHRKHRKIVALAKGFRGSRNRLFKRANEGVVRALEHAFAGRRQKRRDLRRLWITRITAALTDSGINYSRFMSALKNTNIELNRKVLSEMAINDPKAFGDVVEKAKAFFEKK